MMLCDCRSFIYYLFICFYRCRNRRPPSHVLYWSSSNSRSSVPGLCTEGGTIVHEEARGFQAWQHHAFVQCGASCNCSVSSVTSKFQVYLKQHSWLNCLRHKKLIIMVLIRVRSPIFEMGLNKIVQCK